MHKSTEPAALAPALNQSPSRTNSKVCRLNDEKAVQPPQTPYMKNWRPVGPINRRPPGSASAASRPIAKEPEMLTSNVPHGNVSPNWRPTMPENQKRPTLPSAPPIAIHKYASMEDRVQGCKLRGQSQLQSRAKTGPSKLL